MRQSKRDFKLSDDLFDKAGLNENERQLVSLIDSEGRTITDVAAMLGKDKSTVSIQHTAAMKKIGQVVEEQKEQLAEGAEEARVFGFLDRGERLTEIVEKSKIPSTRVEKYYSRWMKLNELDLNHPSAARRVKNLEDKMAEIDGMKNGWEIATIYVMQQPGFEPECSKCIDDMEWVNEPGIYRCPKCHLEWI